MLISYEQLFSTFLWSGKMGNANRAKIRWEYVCLPKEEGGLGLRRVKDSNDASVMKHIWNLFYRKDSLWVAWVQRIYLKQGSFWCAKIPSNCSWSWRKILQLRDRIRPFIRHKVCNGVGHSYGMISGTSWAPSYLALEIFFFG